MCSRLDLDPSSLDRLRAVFSSGRMDLLIGLRKLLDPEAVFELDGQEIPFRPNSRDRLIAHLLWGLPLSAEDLTSGPRVSYGWERLPDSSGRQYERSFNRDQETASESREFKEFFKKMKEDSLRAALLNFQTDGTWEARWKAWNRIYPDWAFPSKDAMRKKVAYLKRTE